MRFVVYGAGAIGGVIGGRLAQHGNDVVLIARGGHQEAIRQRGLRIESPDGDVMLRLQVADRPADIGWRPDDIALLTMKSQDTASAIADLSSVAPRDLPIVCAQNGVENERLALRRFANVYGVCVMCPAAFVTPGVVQAFSSPITGILDVGRYPSGADDVAEAIAAAFGASSFVSVARPDIMRWKYGKLIMNLGNAIQALCGRSAGRGPIATLAREEGLACLQAAGIDFVSDEEDTARRGGLLQTRPVRDRARPGGSTWQSLARGVRTIETDYLNGEVVLLGRLHSVPTPVNELLQHLANETARDGRPPGSMSAQELLALLGPSPLG
jgi:2-dehydropantoate 2-reductase